MTRMALGFVCFWLQTYVSPFLPYSAPMEDGWQSAHQKESQESLVGGQFTTRRGPLFHRSWPH